MKPSEILEKVADTIERYGHRRGEMGDQERGFCVVGGFVYTCQQQSDRLNNGHRAYDAVLEKVGTSIPDWSDSAPTQEILDTLRKTAKEQRLLEEGIR